MESVIFASCKVNGLINVLICMPLKELSDETGLLKVGGRVDEERRLFITSIAREWLYSTLETIYAYSPVKIGARG